jgi:hypothetical protein
MRTGRFQPGQSGNPSGRPPKSRALSDLLIKALNKTVETPLGRVAGKRLLARMVAQALTKGQVQFPQDEKPSIISVKDWLEFVKWSYQYLEPPVQKIAPTTPDGDNPYMGAEAGDLIELANKISGAKE